MKLNTHGISSYYYCVRAKRVWQTVTDYPRNKPKGKHRGEKKNIIFIQSNSSSAASLLLYKDKKSQSFGGKCAYFIILYMHAHNIGTLRRRVWQARQAKRLFREKSSHRQIGKVTARRGWSGSGWLGWNNKKITSLLPDGTYIYTYYDLIKTFVYIIYIVWFLLDVGPPGWPSPRAISHLNTGSVYTLYI